MLQGVASPVVPEVAVDESITPAEPAPPGRETPAVTPPPLVPEAGAGPVPPAAWGPVEAPLAVTE